MPYPMPYPMPSSPFFSNKKIAMLADTVEHAAEAAAAAAAAAGDDGGLAIRADDGAGSDF